MKIKPLILLVTLVLTSFVLVGVTISEFPPELTGTYSPWGDLNDDGVINIFDIVWLTGRYKETGTPVNKTALLYNVSDTFTEILSQIDYLNNELQSRTANLEAQIVDMNETIAGLEFNITQLKNNVSQLWSALKRFEVKSTYSSISDYTTETASWVDMDYMSLTINLRRPSHLLILFSTEAEMTILHGNIIVRATIDGYATNPHSVYLTPTVTEESIPSHRHTLEAGSYSYNFYEPSVPAGNYTIKIQWRLNALYGGTEGCVRDRTMIVLAFSTD